MKKTLLLLSLIPISCLFGCNNKNSNLSTPLTFTCNKDGGKLMLAHVIKNEEPHVTNISWQINGGETQNYTFDSSESPVIWTLGENLKAGDKITIRGDNKEGFTFYEKVDGEEKSCVNEFITNQEDDFSVSGNIMSLLDEKNFSKLKKLPNKGTFANLFANDHVEGVYCYITDASKLLLPATTITESCYESMFFSANKLIKAPAILPSKVMSVRCYANMFEDNFSLVQAPKILGKTASRSCCSRMFSRCTSLETPPKVDFSKTIPAGGCFFWMFIDCGSLKQAIRLSDVGIADSCYTFMFSGCENLRISDKSGVKIFTCPDLGDADEPVDYMFDGFETLVPGTTYYYVE